MRNLKSIGIGLAAASALAVAAPASAQLEPWEDFTPSENVIELTIVKVDEGMMTRYLEGLRSTWVAANEVAKELGHITDYAIWAVPYGDNSFNLMLTIAYPSTESTGPSKERYDAFMEAWGEANMEQSDQTVRELYNKIRTIKGTYLLRELEIKTGE